MGIIVSSSSGELDSVICHNCSPCHVRLSDCRVGYWLHALTGAPMILEFVITCPECCVLRRLLKEHNPHGPLGKAKRSHLPTYFNFTSMAADYRWPSEWGRGYDYRGPYGWGYRKW